MVLNLDNSEDRRLIQASESTKKVSLFLIMNYQRHFSPILAQFFGTKLLTLSVVNNYTQSVDNSRMSIGFQASRSFSAVNNLLIAQNLMCTMKYANLR